MRGNRRVLSQVVEQQRSPTRDGGCDEDSPVGYRFNHTSAAAIIAPAPVSGAVGLPAGDLVPYYASALPTVAAKGHPVNVEENYSALVDTVFNADPDSWGGAYVDGDELMVKVVDLAADDAVATLRSAGIRDGVRVAPSTVSIAELKDLRDRIVAAALPGVVSVGPQYASSTVVVGITKEDPALLAELYRIGGDRVVAYATTQPTAASSRYYDLSPFHGAGQIVLTGTPTGSGTVCSSGFAWNGPTGDSTTYMVTASHCTKEPGINRPTINRVSSSNAWVPIGTIQWTSGNSSGTVSPKHGDTAVYSISNDSNIGKVWDGTYNTTTLRNVIGQRSLPEGWTGTNLYSSGNGPKWRPAEWCTGPGERVAVKAATVIG